MLRIRKKIGKTNLNETEKNYDLHIVIKNYKAGVEKLLFYAYENENNKYYVGP